MDVDTVIRALAKSNKYQTIYSHTKEGGMSLFSNTSNYSELQASFLRYLNFYFNLYTDIAMDYVSEKVLECDIFEDSYFYYKRIVKTDIYKEKESKTNNDPDATRFVMKRPKLEVK